MVRPLDRRTRSRAVRVSDDSTSDDASIAQCDWGGSRRRTLVNEQGDARRRPQVRAVAASHPALEQQLDQALQLFRPQLRRPSRRKSHPQCLLSATPPGMVPAHDRAGSATNATRCFVA